LIKIPPIIALLKIFSVLSYLSNRGSVRLSQLEKGGRGRLVNDFYKKLVALLVIWAFFRTFA